MVTLASFKDFATQFVQVTLPTTMETVASKIGFSSKPISLRAMMDTGTPYVPDLTWAPFVSTSQSTLIFIWTDLANLPPWDWSGSPPNTARAATSWQFTVWPPGGSPVIDATVPMGAENTAGGVQYNYNGELVGDFDYQIRAYNNYGSSSTGQQSVTIPWGNPVQAPTLGLRSNSNYILYSNCNPLIDLTVTINVTQDIACTQGFSFQLNAASPEYKPIAVQQYVIVLLENEIQWLVNIWAGIGSSPTLIGAGGGNLKSLSSSMIPTEYQLRISLQSDATGNITGATFVVIDNGNTLTEKITLTSISDPVKSTDLSPIVAFELNLVGPGNSEGVMLTSGSGSIVYEASSALTVVNSWPCNFEGGTDETSNSIYGVLTSGPSTMFSQLFNIST